MKSSLSFRCDILFCVVIFASLALCGCNKPATESNKKTETAKAEKTVAENRPSETGTTPAATESENDETEQPREKPRELGPPLVDHPDNLKKLHPDYPVWIDKEDKQVIVMGSVCRAGYPLEFFASYPEKDYESVVVIYCKPSIVHAALLTLGAKAGGPVQFDPQFTPPSGDVIEIDVSWKDRNGERKKARAQEWVRDIKTKKQLEVDWVFAGSMFWEDKSTGEKSYLADRGDFISVLNLPTALLDLPIQSASAIESRLFEGFVERMPPSGTPVTLILKPKLENKNAK